MPRRYALVLLAALTLTAPVLIAAPAAAGAGGTCHEPAASVIGTEVGMDDGCFTPSVLHLRPGRTVTFHNPSSTMHTVGTTGRQFGGELPPDEALRVRFDEAGVFPFFCHYHLGMVGAIVVTDVAPADLDELTGAAAAAAAAPAPGGGGPSAGVAAIVAGALGIGAGLVLRGRLRMPRKPERERALAG